MSKMHECLDDVTLTLKKRLRRWASDPENIEAARRYYEGRAEHANLLGEFDPGDIKDIEVENVERVE